VPAERLWHDAADGRVHEDLFPNGMQAERGVKGAGKEGARLTHPCLGGTGLATDFDDVAGEKPAPLEHTWVSGVGWRLTILTWSMKDSPTTNGRAWMRQNRSYAVSSCLQRLCPPRDTIRAAALVP
jgi:hypothetical protein